MTKPTFDQFQVNERRVIHVPTGAAMDFPPKPNWFANPYARCDVTVGKADMLLPNGERYSLAEILDTAWQMLRTGRARAA